MTLSKLQKKSVLFYLLFRGKWELEKGHQSLDNEESLNSGLEGEWRHGEACETREESGEADDNDKAGQIECSLSSSKIWGVELTTQQHSSNNTTSAAVEDAVDRSKYCCCDHLTEIKIFLTIFGLINLGIMASGGVGFALSLSSDHTEETFKYLMASVKLINY